MQAYTITKIDWESFPEDCQPCVTDDGLPAEVHVGAFGDGEERDMYREDAARSGILAHSPDCPYCDCDD